MSQRLAQGLTRRVEIRLNHRNSLGKAKMPFFDLSYCTEQHFTGSIIGGINPNTPRATSNRLALQITVSNTYIKACFIRQCWSIAQQVSASQETPECCKGSCMGGHMWNGTSLLNNLLPTFCNRSLGVALHKWNHIVFERAQLHKNVWESLESSYTMC